MSLKAYIYSKNLLSDRDRLDMFHLHSRFYDNLRKDVFMSDLDEKHWVIILRDHGGGIGGFSTLQRFRLEINERPHHFLFSGDTIVDPRFWLESSLASAFVQLMLTEAESYDDQKLHWFLICKGFRTYRYLPVYFNEFYPRFDRPITEGAKKIINTVARYKFPNNFDCDSGLVRFAGAKDRLCNQLNTVPEGRVANPHIAFFLERNPLFNQGDELACLAEASRENLRNTAFRVFDRCEVEWCI